MIILYIYFRARFKVNNEGIWDHDLGVMVEDTVGGVRYYVCMHSYGDSYN